MHGPRHQRPPPPRHYAARAAPAHLDPPILGGNLACVQRSQRRHPDHDQIQALLLGGGLRRRGPPRVRAAAQVYGLFVPPHHPCAKNAARRVWRRTRRFRRVRCVSCPGPHRRRPRVCLGCQLQGAARVGRAAFAGYTRGSLGRSRGRVEHRRRRPALDGHYARWCGVCLGQRRPRPARPRRRRRAEPAPQDCDADPRAGRGGCGVCRGGAPDQHGCRFTWQGLVDRQQYVWAARARRPRPAHVF